MLATLNLLAFAMHTVLDSAEGLWKQCREYHTVRAFFEELRVLTRRYCFPDWGRLRETMSGRDPPMPCVVARVLTIND